MSSMETEILKKQTQGTKSLMVYQMSCLAVDRYIDLWPRRGIQAGSTDLSHEGAI